MGQYDIKSLLSFRVINCFNFKYHAYQNSFEKEMTYAPSSPLILILGKKMLPKIIWLLGPKFEPPSIFWYPKQIVDRTWFSERTGLLPICMLPTAQQSFFFSLPLQVSRIVLWLHIRAIFIFLSSFHSSFSIADRSTHMQYVDDDCSFCNFIIGLYIVSKFT